MLVICELENLMHGIICNLHLTQSCFSPMFIKKPTTAKKGKSIILLQIQLFFISEWCFMGIVSKKLKNYFFRNYKLFKFKFK